MRPHYMRELYKTHERKILLAGVALFFFIFFPLINHVSTARDAHILSLPIDSAIPFVPFFIIIYFSGFFMPLLTYFTVKKIEDFRRAAIAFTVMMAIAYFIYLVYPVEVILRPISVEGVFSHWFNMYYPVDPPYNAFPSLHVALPCLAAFISCRFDRKYWWMLVWAGLIVVSTVLVKQHYLLDLVAGLVLAVAIYLAFFFKKRKKRRYEKRGYD